MTSSILFRASVLLFCFRFSIIFATECFFASTLYTCICISIHVHVHVQCMCTDLRVSEHVPVLRSHTLSVLSYDPLITFSSSAYTIRKPCYTYAHMHKINTLGPKLDVHVCTCTLKVRPYITCTCTIVHCVRTTFSLSSRPFQFHRHSNGGGLELVGLHVHLIVFTCRHLTVCICPTMVILQVAPTQLTLSVARSHTYMYMCIETVYVHDYSDAQKESKATQHNT